MSLGRGKSKRGGVGVAGGINNCFSPLHWYEVSCHFQTNCDQARSECVVDHKEFLTWKEYQSLMRPVKGCTVDELKWIVQSRNLTELINVIILRRHSRWRCRAIVDYFVVAVKTAWCAGKTRASNSFEHIRYFFSFPLQFVYRSVAFLDISKSILPRIRLCSSILFKLGHMSPCVSQQMHFNRLFPSVGAICNSCVVLDGSGYERTTRTSDVQLNLESFPFLYHHKVIEHFTTGTHSPLFNLSHITLLYQL